MKENGGFATINAFFLLTAVSISVLGMSAALFISKGRIEKRSENLSEYEKLLEETKTVIRLLDDTQDPEADSMFDPVWEYISMKAADYSIFTLADVSSRFNPNWMSHFLFERTDIKKLLLNGTTPGMFREHREKTGFTMNIRPAYGSLIQKKDLDLYFTSYGYMNVNVSDELSLERMFARLSNDPAAAEVFRTFVAEALSSRHIITKEEFNSAAGNYLRSVYPVITAEPAMNVNFIPPFILESILAYPYGGKRMENPDELKEIILNTRENEGITPEKLKGLVNAEGLQQRIFQYLGTKTWFWKLNITGTRTEAEAVIACIPLDVKLNSYVYRLYSFKTDHLKDTE